MSGVSADRKAASEPVHSGVPWAGALHGARQGRVESEPECSGNSKRISRSPAISPGRAPEATRVTLTRKPPPHRPPASLARAAHRPGSARASSPSRWPSRRSRAPARGAAEVGVAVGRPGGGGEGGRAAARAGGREGGGEGGRAAARAGRAAPQSCASRRGERASPPRQTLAWSAARATCTRRPPSTARAGR